MNKIASFCINHDNLHQGMYLSRINEDVLNYDLRMKKTNSDDYLDQAGLHTLEYLYTTYMHNGSVQDHVFNMEQMGCNYREHDLVKARQYTREYRAVIEAVTLIDLSCPKEVTL